MRSKTSFFNRTVFLKALSRFWPVWGIYTLIWAFLFPFALANNLFSPYAGTEPNTLALTAYIYRIVQYGGVIMTFLFGVIAAMAVFSYLYSPKSAGMMHALPIGREGLFFSNYLAGLCFFLIPHAILFLLALFVEAGAGAVSLLPLLVWLGAVTAMAVFFYSFAVFCGMFTGNILALPVFYGILSFLVPVMEYLVRSVLGDFLFGYSNRYSGFVTTTFSPPIRLMSDLSAQAVYSKDAAGVKQEIIGYVLGNWSLLAVYLAAAVALVIAALFVYRARRSESAGDLVSVRGMRPVFKFGVAVCSALALGQLFYYLFSASVSSYSHFDPWILLLCMLILGFVGYFSSEMLLKKTFRVFRQSYKGFLIFSAFLIIFTVTLEWDFWGYEKAVPGAETVQSVTLRIGSTYPYYTGQFTVDEEDGILAVLLLHGDIIQRKASIEQTVRDYYAGVSRDSPMDTTQYNDLDCYIGSERSLTSFQISYSLSDGRIMHRQYTVPVTSEELPDPDRFSGGAEALLNSGEGVFVRSFPPGFSPEDITGGSVSFMGGMRSAELSRAQAVELYEAVMADRFEGTIGRVYLLDNREYYETVYDNAIELYFTGIYPDWINSTGKYGSHSVTVWPETGSLHTVETLNRIGIVKKETPLVTKGISCGIDWYRKASGSD